MDSATANAVLGLRPLANEEPLTGASLEIPGDRNVNALPVGLQRFIASKGDRAHPQPPVRTLSGHADVRKALG